MRAVPTWLRDESGFTLLEMLVATTLLGLLSLVLYGALQFGLRSWHRSEELSVESNSVRRVQALLTADLTRAYPEVLRTDPTRRPIDFDGARDRIRYLTPNNGRPGALDRVVLSEQATALTRVASLELGTTARTDSKILLPKVESFEISYFGPNEDDKSPHWQESWHDRETLPSMVRFRARLAGGQSWPDLIVAPALSADATCNFDPLIKNCREP